MSSRVVVDRGIYQGAACQKELLLGLNGVPDHNASLTTGWYWAWGLPESCSVQGQPE